MLQTVFFDKLTTFRLSCVETLPEINLKLQTNIATVDLGYHLLKRLQLPEYVSRLEIVESIDGSELDFADFEGFNFTELIIDNCKLKSQHLFKP